MTTAEKINHFSDPGAFQILMDSVLRFSNPEYASIISTGVNIEGKAIKSPLDGFTRIPGSNPPKYILVQHTTAKLEDLESKWLLDHTTTTGKGKYERQDGDVIKAAQYAQEIRQNNSDAEFILILTTNRHLSLNKQKKQDPLVLKTYQKCQEHNIQCEIWEQSRITHFLDNTPEGHWLRKEFLGIEAELLSEKLLETICKKNLERYKQAFFLGNDDHLQRELESIVEREINRQHKGLNLLVGEPGYGKSTISYHLLKNHIESGGFGLWISVDNVEEGLPLETIIAKTLKRFHSKVQIDSDSDIWDFAKNHHFYIVIDDLNRSVDPTRIIQRAISLLPQESTKYEGHDVNSPFAIICPVWPKYWTPISREFRNNQQIRQIRVDKFTLDEAASVIFNAFQKCDNQITRLQADQFAKDIGCDPLLVGLFSQSLRGDDDQISSLSGGVIDHFIQRSLDEIAGKSPSHFLNLEYNEVLSRICNEMLIQKNYFPTFTQIEDWLSDNHKHTHIFRELIAGRTLCSIDAGKLVFRHDRIQFHLLIRSMLKLLESEASIRSNIISEPYYAELLGQSILIKKQTDHQLDEIQEKNILSLFEALKIFGEPSTQYHEKIIDRITAWIKTEKRRGYPHSSIIDAICWILIDTDSSAIIPITDYLPRYYSVRFARIRNGCVDDGVHVCSNYHHFEPRTNFPLRDRIFEHAKEKHHQKILNGLKGKLQSDAISDKHRYGALIFLGFLKFPSFEKDILTCWNNAQDKKQLLPAALWAGLNCCDGNLNEVLGPMIGYWETLPDDYEPESGKIPDKLEISEHLRFSVTNDMSNHAVNFLISHTEKFNSLTWPILTVLHAVDDPDAVEFVVKKAALDHLGFFFSSNISDPWNPKIFSYARLLSSQSLKRLETLWKNDESHPDVRKKAFRLWQTGANITDIEKLKSVLPNSPVFKESVLLRIQLKDWSGIPDYLSLISHDCYYLFVAHHVWCDDIKKVVENYLISFEENIPEDFNGGRLDEHYALSSLIMAIPEEDAEQLLDKYWDYLKFSRLFIQSALYIGTKKCLALANDAINECPQSIDVFEHISGHFCVNDQERPRTLTLKRLNDLKPYLSRFTETETQLLYSTCNRCGFTDWARENLIEHLSEEAKKRYLLSDRDLQQYLQQPELKKHLDFHISEWIERNKWGKDTRERLFRIGRKLLMDDPSQTNLEIVSVLLKICGSRSDLGILDEFTYAGDEQEILKIKQDARFHVLRRTIE